MTEYAYHKQNFVESVLGIKRVNTVVRNALPEAGFSVDQAELPGIRILQLGSVWLLLRESDWYR
ncbi:MAG: hypothetical protein JWQ42_3921 [Edaphobacter sp.]|jgi:hypothetical protein|nr:hypothetical protein [Edaphobacter sp.]